MARQKCSEVVSWDNLVRHKVGERLSLAFNSVLPGERRATLMQADTF